jgi:hypothetical protein
MQRFIPHSERRPQVYILAKNAGYFNPKDRSWDPEYFGLASAASGVDFLAGVRESKLPEYFPQNVTNIGFMSQMQFYETLLIRKKANYDIVKCRLCIVCSPVQRYPFM